MPQSVDAARVRAAAEAVLAGFEPGKVDDATLFGAWFDAGLAWVQLPEGRGGLGVSRHLQSVADQALIARGGVPPKSVLKIGYGFVAPTLLKYAAPALLERLLRPLATGEELWCQLFSEPGAGSDLPSLATMARRDGDRWIVNGQKVWTSQAHRARWAILLARTDPDLPKHAGLSFFVLDMRQPGVAVRPLRQMTGRTEFNEVFVSDAVVEDGFRLGAVGAGWEVARHTLANERMSAGNRHRGGNAPLPIADALAVWERLPARRTPALRDRLVRLWLRAEAHRLTCERLAVETAAEAGTIAKIAGTELNQACYEFCIDMMGVDGLVLDYAGVETVPVAEASIQERFLRSRANTIEGGTSEVMRNIIAERILGMPAEVQPDRGRPWRETRRS